MVINKKNIARGNELLAKFIGANPCSRCDEIGNDECGGYEFIKYGPIFTPEEMKFNSSWDWIMDVVEKVNQMDDGSFYISIEPYETRIEYFKDNDCYEKIVASAHHSQIPKSYKYIMITWKAMVEFVEWYNKKK